jgi:hypothetical protein
LQKVEEELRGALDVLKQVMRTTTTQTNGREEMTRTATF